MLGTCLNNRYRLRSILSDRTTQKTYLAWDNERCTQVVIKVLPFSYGFDWENLKHFERETNFLKQLSHPAIPQYLDGFEIDLPNFKGFAWVQAYIEAQSLAEHIQQGRTFSEDDLTQISTDVLAVLIFLHGRNPAIVHRDIKPSNILLGDRSGHTCGKVHLIDFGSIQLGQSALESTVTVAGTFGYGAPEQFRGDAIPASDLYGLGMTLIHLITGTNPAHLPIRNGRVVFDSPQTSSHFRSWIIGLTQTETCKRFGSAAAAQGALTQENFNLPQLSTCLLPPDSRITFSKISAGFSVTVPPVGFSWYKMAEIFGKVLCNMFFLGIWFIPLFGWLFIGYSLLGALCLSVTAILKDLVTHSYLTVTETNITWLTRWGYLSKDKQSISTKVSKLVQISPRVTIRDHGDNTIRKDFPPALEIYANNKKLRITAPAQIVNNTHNRAHGLTVPELDWLASELSDWFDIPLEKQPFPVQINPVEVVK